MRVRALALFMTHQATMHLLTVVGLTVALPQMMDDFQADVPTVAWVQLAYGLALAAGSFQMARLTTMFDRRALVLIGTLSDVVLCLLIFVTSNIYVFIVARFFQGLVRLFPWLVLQVIGIGGFPPEQRGKVIGLTSLEQGTAAMLAVPLTAWVTHEWGWRWMFMICAVMYALFAVAVRLVLPKDDPATVRPRLSLASFDVWGSALLVVGMVALLAGVQTLIRDYGTTAGIGLIVVGAVTLAAFVRVELRAENPIVRFSLFKIQGVFLGATQAIFIGLLFGSLTLLLPFLLIKGYGWSVVYAGGILFFLNVARPVTSPVAGWLSDRFGSTAVILPAAVAAVVSQLVAAAMGMHPSLEILITTFLVIGLSQTLLSTANLRQIYGAVPAAFLHLAPSTNTVLLQIGNTGGTALAAAALAVRPSITAAAGLGDPGLVAAASTAIVVTTTVFAVGMALTQLLPRLLPVIIQGPARPAEQS